MSSMACLMQSANACESVRGLERLLWMIHDTGREEEGGKGREMGGKDGKRGRDKEHGERESDNIMIV